MRCYPRGGYLNPGYGAWGLGVAIQMTVALCLMMLAAGDLDGPNPEGDRPHRISCVSSRFFKTMALLHLIGSCVTTGFVLIGYLGVQFFLCPLPVVTILNWGLLFCTAAYCSYIISHVQDVQMLRLRHKRHPDWGPLRTIDYSETWAHSNQTALLYIACMCVAEAACYLHGLVYSKDSTTGTRATAWFNSSVLILLSGMVIILMTALRRYSAIAIVWFVLWALLTVVSMLQQYCWYRRLAVVISVLFLLSVAYSVAVWLVAAISYSKTKIYTFSWDKMTPRDIASLPDEDYSWLKACVSSNFGKSFMFECLSTTAVFIMALFSAMYAVYSVFTKRPPGEEKKKDSADADETHLQADEKTKLNGRSQCYEDATEQA